MAQSYLVTLNRWCYGCMSNNDGLKLQTYYIQDEALQTIIQSDQIILCYLCQRVAQKAEQFIYNVQHSQIWLESRKEFSDTEIKSIKDIQGIHPLVNLSSILPSQEDIIALSGTNEEEFYFKEVKLEFDDNNEDTQNTAKQEQDNISGAIELGCQNTTEPTKGETHNSAESIEAQKLNHEDVTEIIGKGCQDITETTEQIHHNYTESPEAQKLDDEDVTEIIEKGSQHIDESTEQIHHDNTESPEVQSNNTEISDDTLSESSLSDGNGEENEEEGNCIGRVECTLLTEEEFREEMVENAKKQYYLEAPFKCVDCVRHYRMKATYERHMELHKETSGDQECSLCKQRKKTSDQLANHYIRHLQRFKCCKCDLVRKYASDIHDHYRKAHEKCRNAITCTICNKVFSSKKSLHQHMNYKHSDQTPVKCPYCEKTFKNKYSLPAHLVRVHNEQVSGKRHTCEVCHCSFVYKMSLTRHMQTHSEETNDYYCVECDKQYKSEHALGLHFKYAAAHVNVADRSLTCPQCDKRFTNRRTLRGHLSAHDGVFNFQCAHCDKAFTLKYRLASHILKVHLKDTIPRKYPCTFCDKAFRTNRILKEHIRTHTGEKPLKCDKCSAEFAHPSTLYNHNKIVHLGLKRKRTVKGGKTRKKKIVRKSETSAESSDFSD